MTDTIRAILIAGLITVAARADSITLRDGAGVAQAGVTLADIAELDGDRATSLADVAVGQFVADSTSLSISRAQIQQSLEAHGINWGFVSLRGSQRITVERCNPDETAQANPIAPVNADVAAPVVAKGQTLKELVTAWVIESSGQPPDQLKIDLIDPTDTLWNINEADGRIELEADAARLVGRVPFAVRQYRDGSAVSSSNGELIAAQRVAVDVAVRKAVVVALTTIHRGQTITDADMHAQTQWLNSARIDPIGDPQLLVGQTAKRLISPGTVIEAGDVQPRALVKRGELLTVRVISGGIVVKTIARAAEDGQAGQVIEVRHLRTRDSYHVQVTAPQEAVMLIDAQSAETTATTNNEANKS